MRIGALTNRAEQLDFRIYKFEQECAVAFGDVVATGDENNSRGVHVAANSWPSCGVQSASGRQCEYKAAPGS